MNDKEEIQKLKAENAALRKQLAEHGDEPENADPEIKYPMATPEQQQQAQRAAPTKAQAHDDKRVSASDAAKAAKAAEAAKHAPPAKNPYSSR